VKLWRTTAPQFVSTTLSGEGAMRFGGRWNSVGHQVIYTTPTKSLGVLNIDFFSAQDWDRQTKLQYRQKLLFIRIDVPDSVSRKSIDLSELPTDWTSHDSVESTRRIGDLWISLHDTCLLRVPSLIIPGESEYLINRQHKEFSHLIPYPPVSFDSFKEYMNNLSQQRILFLCHASEDKDEVVRPLRDALFDRGISCWLDEAEITLGDSITEKVNLGLGQAEFVVVIISPAFLQKNWPQRELRAALNREARQGKKVILPIIVNYPNKTVDLSAFLPIIEDKLYYTWSDNPSDAAETIEKVVRSSEGK
jgi:RES domain-containing protein